MNHTKIRTVAALHKALGQLVAAGHGRKPVCIDKETFTDRLEIDGATILDVASVDGPKWIYKMDDDGGVKINADGSESGRFTVVLKGVSYEHQAKEG